MRRTFLVLAMTAALAFLAPAGSEGQQVRRPASIDGATAEVVDAELSLTRTVELPAVSMTEILGTIARGGGSGNAAPGGLAMSLGTWSPSSAAMAGRAATAVEALRRAENLWQIRLPGEQRRTQHLDVAYQIHGLDGRRGALTHPADSFSQVRVRLEPIAPTLVGADDDDVLQGGVTLHLDLSGIRRAGQHLGSLTVTFNNF